MKGGLMRLWHWLTGSPPPPPPVEDEPPPQRAHMPELHRYRNELTKHSIRTDLMRQQIAQALAAETYRDREGEGGGDGR